MAVDKAWPALSGGPLDSTAGVGHDWALIPGRASPLIVTGRFAPRLPRPFAAYPPEKSYTAGRVHRDTRCSDAGGARRAAARAWRRHHRLCPRADLQIRVPLERFAHFGVLKSFAVWHVTSRSCSYWALGPIRWLHRWLFNVKNVREQPSSGKIRRRGIRAGKCCLPFGRNDQREDGRCKPRLCSGQYS